MMMMMMMMMIREADVQCRYADMRGQAFILHHQVRHDRLKRIQLILKWNLLLCLGRGQQLLLTNCWGWD